MSSAQLGVPCEKMQCAFLDSLVVQLPDTTQRHWQPSNHFSFWMEVNQKCDGGNPDKQGYVQSPGSTGFFSENILRGQDQYLLRIEAGLVLQVIQDHDCTFRAAVLRWGRHWLHPADGQQSLNLIRCRFDYHSRGFSRGRAFPLATVPADEYFRHQALALPDKCLSKSQPVMLILAVDRPSTALLRARRRTLRGLRAFLRADSWTDVI